MENEDEVKQQEVIDPDKPEVAEPEAVAEPEEELTFPITALVKKYADKVAVEVRDMAHLTALRLEHGKEAVELALHIIPPSAKKEAA